MYERFYYKQHTGYNLEEIINIPFQPEWKASPKALKTNTILE